jgi:PKD repeat protein/C1A family cysteine protease
MKINRPGMRGLLSIALIVLISGVAGYGSAKETDPRMTGLPELTKEEIQWQNKHMLKVKKIKLNDLGLKRVNQWRKKNNKIRIEKNAVPVSKIGNELEVAAGETVVSEISFPLPASDLPGNVDNSQLKYFPPIRSQGSLNSCGVFSGVYYTMTHMQALAKDLDAKNGGDSLRLSPKWAYNMVNGGTNSGSWYYWAYEIGQSHGISTWAEFPYDSDYRSWNRDPEVWETSLYRKFDQYGYVMDTHTEKGIDQVKQMLLNGYVLNFPTYINSWNWKTIGNDPDTIEDDPFVGKQCAYFVNGTLGYHAMTVVGYNDSVWVDINGNNIVDAGEKGAFRIANSWGTGWGESGFAWMAYDSLKNPSEVAGGPSANRIYGWSPSRAHWVTAKSSYQPKLIGRFTLNHLKRDQLRMTIGVSEIDASSPSTVQVPEMIYNQGGALGFDGTANASSATFVYDFTDLLPAASGMNRYYIGMQDDTAGDDAFLESFALIDVASGGLEIASMDNSLSTDAGQVYMAADYDYFDGNTAPVAQAFADTFSGQAPLPVSFDGSGSYDTDGSIVACHWDFGDGASQSGVSVDHTYENAGTFTATLTVTDDMGATASESMAIEATPDPSRVVFISDLTAELTSNPAGKTVKVTAAVMDHNSNPVSGSTIQGQWSGLVSGDVSGITGTDGTVTFVSRKTKKTGEIVFAVIRVDASGYTYDPDFDTFSFVSVSTDETVISQDPVADIQADTLSGQAPLDVFLDGRSSSDPDGDIVSYEWILDNGETYDGSTLDYTFYEAGTHEVLLMVTDAMGNTSTDTVTILVLSGQEKTMRVSEIAMDIQFLGKNAVGHALVTIVDLEGVPVNNAVVSGTWSGVVQSSLSDTTDAYGSVGFTSPKTKSSGVFVFTIENVAAEGYVYDSENNIETSDSIDIQ